MHSLKLSPNLRKRSKEAQKAIQDEDMKEYMKLEVKKLDQLLTQVIEANNDSMSNWDENVMKLVNIKINQL